jgi:hypothetical protein
MRSSAKRIYVLLLIFTVLFTHASAISLTGFKYVGEVPKIFKNIKALKLGTKIWE